MMTALPKIPNGMSVAEFLVWETPPNQRWQLVDGEPQAMAPASTTHAAIQSELGRIIGNHLLEGESPCRILTEPGIVPRVQAEINFRISDLAVTCTGLEADETTISAPVLLIEILSSSNQAETWANVWTYTTIPSVEEIFIVQSERVAAELLHRGPDGIWPDKPLSIERGGNVILESIGFTFPLMKAYRTTRLAQKGN